MDAYRLRDDATLTIRDDGALVLRLARYQLVLDGLGVGRRSVALRLAEAWTTDMEIGELVTAVEGESRILQVQVLVRGLHAHSWLGRRLYTDGRALLEVIPRGLGSNSLPRPAIHDPAASYVLSRFAVSRAAGGRLVTETPLSTLAVAMDPDLHAALVRAAGPGLDRAELADRAGLPEPVAGRVLDDLLTARILVGAADAKAEVEAAPLAAWSPEELALHDRSRPGRHVLPVGGTYPLRGRLDPEPLVRRFADREAVPLPVPDLDTAAKSDPSLTEVVGARRTLRRHDPHHPITVEQLAEFLYRVQRLTGTGTLDGAEVGHRPYPSGGALYELEVYAIVHHCAGLAAGVYHYDSEGHRLEHLGALEDAARRALDYVSASATFTAPPQVYLVVTARVGRLMWKYEGLAYTLILKHAGVLTELMYLVATAMGLAPCAVGAGDSAAFAAATGLDPLAEPSVADFTLGSCLPEDAPIWTVGSQP
jgi:SagB-type dehydrogenase family enzyme